MPTASAIQPNDYEGYARLAAASPVHIAAGEQESNRASFLDLMDRGRVDIVQVDLTRCGGFTEAMKIASLAADRGLPSRTRASALTSTSTPRCTG